MVRPPGTDQIARGQKKPSDNRPAPRTHDPGFVEFAGDQCGHRERVWDRQPDEAGVKERRVRHHVGVFEQRI